MLQGNHVKSSEIHRKHILLYSTVCSFLSSVLIAGICIGPFYASLRKNADKDLALMLDIKATVVEQFLKRAENIALQISSRTVIAEELERYDKGLVSLEELDSYTVPKMEDSVVRAKDVAGVWRLDAKGHPVVRIGAAIGRNPPVGVGPDGSVLSGPFMIGDESFLCARAPVLNRKSERIGTDIVLFKLTDLRAIMGDRHGSEKGGEFFLGAAQGQRVRLLFSPSNDVGKSGDHLKTAFLESLLKGAFQKKSGVQEAENSLGRPGIVVCRPLKDIRWGIAIWKGKKDVYGSTNRNIMLVCCCIVGVIVIGTFGMLLILRPLVGKLIIHGEDLENEVRLKTTALARELAERGRAEAALRESEERYRTLFEDANDGIAVVVEETGVPLDCNQAFCRMVERAKEEIIGQPQSQLHPPADLEDGLSSGYRRFRPNPSPGLHEDRLISKNGKIIPVEIQSTHFQVGGQNYVMGIFRDITDRKQNEERRRTILKTAMDGFWLTDGKGRLLEVNDRYCRMSGYSEEELLAMSISDLEASGKEAETAARINEIKARGEDRFESRHRRGDGSILDVEVSVQYRAEEGGQFIVFLRDITELKRAAEERRSLQAQLNQAQKMESVGKLAGGVAHDFNNMLGVILGHTEMAMEQIDQTHAFFGDLTEIRKAAMRSADLTRQLLAFARKQTIAPRILDMNETVEGMLKMLRRLIGEDIDLAWLPARGLWPVKVDPGQIDQILANLCVNARDAISGTGKVTIETKNIIFDDNYCAVHPGFVPGEFVMIAVSDDGGGMDNETLEHIFEPFFTTKEVGKGTGLGLSTVYGIVRQNNGAINVDSEPNRGTTFKLCLPRAGEQPADRQPVLAKRDLRGKETVLLVEDEGPLLALGKNILQRYGYEVLATKSPNDALEMLKSYPGHVHLLITDVVMPEMNGKDLRDKLAEVKNGFKSIFMSGYTANVMAHQGILPEDINFLPKPFSIQTLLEKVRDVLDG